MQFQFPSAYDITVLNHLPKISLLERFVNSTSVVVSESFIFTILRFNRYSSQSSVKKSNVASLRIRLYFRGFVFTFCYVFYRYKVLFRYRILLYQEDSDQNRYLYLILFPEPRIYLLFFVLYGRKYYNFRIPDQP